MVTLPGRPHGVGRSTPPPRRPPCSGSARSWSATLAVGDRRVSCDAYPSLKTMFSSSPRRAPPTSCSCIDVADRCVLDAAQPPSAEIAPLARRCRASSRGVAAGSRRGPRGTAESYVRHGCQVTAPSRCRRRAAAAQSAARRPAGSGAGRRRRPAGTRRREPELPGHRQSRDRHVAEDAAADASQSWHGVHPITSAARTWGEMDHLVGGRHLRRPTTRTVGEEPPPATGTFHWAEVHRCSVVRRERRSDGMSRAPGRLRLPWKARQEPPRRRRSRPMNTSS